MKHLCENFDLTQKGWCRDVNKMRETIISAFHDTDMEIFKPDLIDTGCTCTGVLSVIGENLLFFVRCFATLKLRLLRRANTAFGLRCNSVIVTPVFLV